MALAGLVMDQPTPECCRLSSALLTPSKTPMRQGDGSDDDDDSDEEAAQPVSLGGKVRTNPRRYVEGWLLREARQADDVACWHRVVRSRHEPLLVLRQLAAVQRRLLVDVRRRAQAQCEHEAALVLQFRMHRLLVDGSPAMADRYAERYAASRTAAEAQVALSRFKARAELQRTLRTIAEWRFDVFQEAERTFERATAELGAKVATLRRQMHRSEACLQHEAAQAPGRGVSGAARGSQIYTQICKEQEALVKAERELQALSATLLHEFGESSVDEASVHARAGAERAPCSSTQELPTGPTAPSCNPLYHRARRAFLQPSLSPPRPPERASLSAPRPAAS
eukprot:5190714-Prymnesium_polylepis.1